MEFIRHIEGTYGDITIELGRSAAGNLEDCRAAVVIPFLNGRLLMTYHPARAGWEFPGGTREQGETVEECALRETLEETGAAVRNLQPLGFYRVSRDGKILTKTALYTAEAAGLAEKPGWSETGEVVAFETLPENISFKDDVYKIVLEYLREGRYYSE